MLILGSIFPAVLEYWGWSLECGSEAAALWSLYIFSAAAAEVKFPGAGI